MLGLWSRWFWGFQARGVMKERWQRATCRKIYYENNIPWSTSKKPPNILFDYCIEYSESKKNVVQGIAQMTNDFFKGTVLSVSLRK